MPQQCSWIVPYTVLPASFKCTPSKAPLILSFESTGTGIVSYNECVFVCCALTKQPNPKASFQMVKNRELCELFSRATGGTQHPTHSEKQP